MNRSQWRANLYYSLLSALLLPRRLLRDVRTRLTLIAGLIIVVVVTFAMYLTATHAADLVQRDTRLAMSNVAVTVLDSVASQPDAPPLVYERFLQTMVNAKLEDEVFAVDIVFALLQNSHGTVLALAADEPVLERLGWPISGDRGDKIAALQALSVDPTLARQHGLIVVQASMESGQPPMTVTLGCRRSAASYVTSQIVARHVAVGIIIVLTALISLWVVLGHATRPIRRVFQAVNLVSNGRLNQPLLPRQRDEVGKVAESVDEIRLALARGRQWQDLALGMLSTNAVELSHLPEGAVYLAVPLPVSGGEGGFLPELLEGLMAQEGTVEGEAGGYLLASWGREGGEQDDLLRAVVAGLEVSEEALRRSGDPLHPVVSRSAEAILKGVRSPAAPTKAVAVWLEATALEELQPALEAGDLAATGEKGGAWQAITWGGTR